MINAIFITWYEAHRQALSIITVLNKGGTGKEVESRELIESYNPGIVW